MGKLLLTAIICGALVGCAAQEPLKKQTASGKPEAEYPNKTKEQVVEGIVEMCNNSGYRVEDQKDNYVICAKDLEGGSALFTQMMIGNSYSTTPQGKVRFSVSQIKNGSKVWADVWTETQMAMGQVNKMPVTATKTLNQMQDALDIKLPQILNIK